jgi:hypothetical protein
MQGGKGGAYVKREPKGPNMIQTIEKRFTDIYRKYCKWDDDKLRLYLEDLQTYQVINTCKHWASVPLRWYDEIEPNKLVSSNICFSSVIKNEHLGRVDEVRKVPRFVTKSAIACMMPVRYAKFDKWYGKLMEQFAGGKILDYCGDFQCFYICVLILRISHASFNSSTFVELFKIQSRIKILENALVFNLCYLFGLDGMRIALRLCRIVEKCWNTFNEGAMERVKFIHIDQQYNVVYPLLTACVMDAYINDEMEILPTGAEVLRMYSAIWGVMDEFVFDLQWIGMGTRCFTHMENVMQKVNVIIPSYVQTLFDLSNGEFWLIKLKDRAEIIVGKKFKGMVKHSSFLNYFEDNGFIIRDATHDDFICEMSHFSGITARSFIESGGHGKLSKTFYDHMAGTVDDRRLAVRSRLRSIRSENEMEDLEWAATMKSRHANEVRK